MLIDGGKSLVPFWLVAAAGRPTEEVRLDTGKHFEDLWRGGWDPVARLADQDLDGVTRRGDLPVGRHAALQLPRHRLPARVLRRVQPVDRRVLRDRARPAHRAWARPRCARRTEGIADLEAIKALGLRGVMLPGHAAAGRLRRPDVRRVLGRGRRPRAAAVVPHPHEQERRAVRQGARPAAQHVHDDPARATRTSSA